MSDHDGFELDIEVVGADGDVRLDADVDADVEVGVDEAALDAAIVDRMVRDAVRVPPFPQVVVELQRLSAADAGLQRFVDVVARDPALAARVMRVANSASFGRVDGVKTLAGAVTNLGTGMLLRVALADGLAGSAAVDGPLVALRDQAWRQAVTAALLSSMLARGRGLAADEVFVDALLHDFGRLLAVRVIEDVIAADGVAFVEAVSAGVWRDLVERYRTELGILAAERWHMPEALRTIIGTHHLRPRGHPLIALLNAVDDVIALLEGGGAVEEDALVARGLDVREAGVVLRALPSLPALVASFTIERLSVRPAVAERVTATPAPAALAATTVGTSVARTFVVRALGAQGMVLRGRDGLAVHQVFRLRFAFSPPQEIWVRVTAVARADDGVDVHAVPFALRGAEAGQWYARVRALSAGGIAAPR